MSLIIYFYLKFNLDEQGTPYCCGGPIPEEYNSQYGGYADDYDGGSMTYVKKSLFFSNQNFFNLLFNLD